MKKIAEYFKALSDETRLRILRLLAREEKCVCELMDELKMSQSAVSHHLKILKQAGLVKDSRDGKWIFYSLGGDSFQQYHRAFLELFNNNGNEESTPLVPEPAGSRNYVVCSRLDPEQGKGKK